MTKPHTHCRACDTELPAPYLDLGLLPLSNNLADSPTDPIHDQRYPLRVCACSVCGLNQLDIVVDPAVMFSNYVYRSGVSQGYRDHCKEWARTVSLTNQSFHIDIAGNDGTLLDEFRKVHGHKVLNVDPARNLVPINDALGIRQYVKFWGIEAAQHLINTDWPKADLITATNVFAHVDDVKSFMKACKMVLAPEGKIMIECPSGAQMIATGAWDTIYFEHLSYMNIHPMVLIAESAGLALKRISFHDIHGGSIRYEIGFGKRFETNYYDLNNFAANVRTTVESLRDFIGNHNNIAGFACSAKGNTLLNVAGLNNAHLRYIIDQTPEKIGKYSPGTRIPVFDLDKLISDPPEYLLILAWNFTDEIIAKCKAAGYKGKFVVPMPNIAVYD